MTPLPVGKMNLEGGGGGGGYVKRSERSYDGGTMYIRVGGKRRAGKNSVQV